MTRVTTLIRHDVRLQYRYGIYLAYAFVVAVYAAELYWAGPHLPDWVAAVIVFTDPAALGFFFLGALMMLERSEGVRTALATTPLRAVDYFAAKAATLTGLALIACTMLLPLLPDPKTAWLLLLTVALTSIQYIGIGFPIALRFRTVSGYLIGSAGFLTPLIAPGFMAMIEDLPAIAYLVPAVSQLRLMLVATGAADAMPVEVAGMLAVAATAAGAAAWLGIRALTREFGR